MGCTLFTPRTSAALRALRILLRAHGWSKAGSGWALSTLCQDSGGWTEFVHESNGTTVTVHWQQGR